MYQIQGPRSIFILILFSVQHFEICQGAVIKQIKKAV